MLGPHGEHMLSERSHPTIRMFEHAKIRQRQTTAERRRGETYGQKKKKVGRKIKALTAFVCEPYLTLDPHWRWNLLGDAHLRWNRDGMIVPHGRHLAVPICRIDIRNLVNTSVALGAS